MGLSPKAVRGFAAFSFAALLTVAILPSTSGVVRSQLLLPRYVATLSAFTRVASSSPAVQRELTQHPGNIQERLALADSPEDLRALVREFPQSPSVYAAYLSAVLEESAYVHMDRPDELAFESEQSQTGSPHRTAGKAPTTYPGSSTAAGYPGGGDLSPGERAVLASTQPKPKSAAEIADMEQVAITAERVDPGNAFFPAVRAYILFAHHQDDDAVAELWRAGRAARWESYATEQTWGRQELFERAYHDRTAFSHVTIESSQHLRSDAAFRELARVADFKATLAARAGREEQGISIRHSIIRWGSLMAVSHTTAESLVGIAIASIGACPPNARQQPGFYAAAQAHQLPVQYERYLRRTGYPQEAAWVAAQSSLLNCCRGIVLQDMALPGGAIDVLSLYRLALLWAMELLLLASALAVLLIGGAAAVVRKHGERVRLRWFCLVPLAALCAVAPVAWAAGQFGYWGEFNLHDPSCIAFLGSLPLVVPFFMGVGSGIYSLVRRVPLLTGVTRGLCAAAVPVASLLVLCYALLAPMTAFLDNELTARASRAIQDETGAAAAHVHQPWPTQVPQ